MARASNIYLVWRASDGAGGDRYVVRDRLVGAFTVKYESQDWAARQPGGLNAHKRTRIADGVYSDKTEQSCPWEPATGFNVKGTQTGRFQS